MSCGCRDRLCVECKAAIIATETERDCLRAEVERLEAESEDRRQRLIQVLIERDAYKAQAEARIGVRREVLAELGVTPEQELHFDDAELKAVLARIRAMRAKAVE